MSRLFSPEEELDSPIIMNKLSSPEEELKTHGEALALKLRILNRDLPSLQSLNPLIR